MLTTRLDGKRVPLAFRRGFALPSAIFLLVIMAALGAFIVSLTSTQSITQAQDVDGVRAYWAARGAAEYALAKVLAPEDVSGPTSFSDCSEATWPSALNNQLDGYSVTLRCVRAPATGHYTENGFNLVIYTVEAVLSKGTPGGINFVERKVTVKAAKCKDPNAVLPGGGSDARHRCG